MSGIVYGDYTRDRVGWFFGMTGPQLALVALGALPGLLAAGASRWAAAGVWAAGWAVLVASVAVRVRGRCAVGWLTALGLHTLGTLTGWSTWRAPAATTTGGGPGEAGRVDLPGILAGIHIHDGPPHGPGSTRVALIADHGAATWAVTAAVVHPGIGMSEPAERDRLGAGLAELAETIAATGTISMLVVQVRTVPDDGAERAAWVGAHERPDAPALARTITTDLAVALTGAAVRTETFVTIVASEAALRRPARQAGGGVHGRAMVLYSAMAEVAARLCSSVGASSLTWLDSPALAAAVRTGFAPGDRHGMVSATAAPGTPGAGVGVPWAAAGPSAATAPVRHYRHDAWSSVSATLLLPDRGALIGALAPVMTPTAAGERRAVTVFLPTVAPTAADKVSARTAMSALTSAELRRRTGRLPRARHATAEHRAHTLDAKLSHGRALVRPAAVAAVTVPATWPVEEYGRRLEASIRRAGFAPLRLDLAQDGGFAAAAIPLGVGLPAQGSR